MNAFRDIFINPFPLMTCILDRSGNRNNSEAEKGLLAVWNRVWFDSFGSYLYSASLFIRHTSCTIWSLPTKSIHGDLDEINLTPTVIFRGLPVLLTTGSLFSTCFRILVTLQSYFVFSSFASQEYWVINCRGIVVIEFNILRVVCKLVSNLIQSLIHFTQSRSILFQVWLFNAS